MSGDAAPLDTAHVERIIQIMRTDGDSYWYEDWWEGEARSYQYKADRGCFLYVEMDTAVGSYLNQYEYSTEQMRSVLLGMNRGQARGYGFPD